MGGMLTGTIKQGLGCGPRPILYVFAMGETTEKPLDTSPQTLISFPWFVRALRGHTLAHWVPTLVVFGNLFAKIVSCVQKYLDRWAEGKPFLFPNHSAPNLHAE